MLYLQAAATGDATATTYRWPSSWSFATLRSFIQPVVDAACHARLHHSCFLFGQGQRSAKPGRHRQQGLCRKCWWIGLFPLFFSLSLLQPHRHTLSFTNFLSSSSAWVFYLEGAPAAAMWAERIAFLPHALDVTYAVGDHGQIHRSGARLLVLPLLTQSRGFKSVDFSWWLLWSKFR